MHTNQKNKKKRFEISKTNPLLHGNAENMIDRLEHKLVQTNDDDRKILESKTLLAVYTSAIGALYKYQCNADPEEDTFISFDKNIISLFQQMKLSEDTTDMTLQKRIPFDTLIEKKFVTYPIVKKEEYTSFVFGIPFIDTHLKMNIRLRDKSVDTCEQLANIFRNNILDTLDLLEEYVEKKKALLNLVEIIKGEAMLLKGTNYADIGYDLHSTIIPILLCLNHLPENRILHRNQLKKDVDKPLILLCKTARYHFFFEPVSALTDLKTSDVSTGENPKKDANISP